MQTFGLLIIMLVFPNCKINLGLHVVSKRQDGFHSIETVFYPVNWCDALEVIESPKGSPDFTFSHSGMSISGPSHQNLIYRAWELIKQTKNIGPLQVHLHKNIPMGAGLGGGSSDAAFFINLLDKKFNLSFSIDEKVNLAKQLGSDCAFFISNDPVFAQGKGDEFSNIQVDLSAYYILVVYPAIHSNTADAYASLVPKTPSLDLRTIITNHSAEEWRNLLVNDFESPLFKKYPAIKELKEQLYASGAMYASMSGSGSAVYGIFKTEPKVELPKDHLYYLQKPFNKIL